MYTVLEELFHLLTCNRTMCSTILSATLPFHHRGIALLRTTQHPSRQGGREITRITPVEFVRPIATVSGHSCRKRSLPPPSLFYRRGSCYWSTQRSRLSYLIVKVEPGHNRIALFMSSTITGRAGGLSIPAHSDTTMLADCSNTRLFSSFRNSR